MPRASNVITLVLLGSALALIGWSCYEAWEDTTDGQGRHYYGGHGSHIWFWGGGWGGGSSVGRSGPVSGGSTVHGGFGATGGAVGVGG